MEGQLLPLSGNCIQGIASKWKRGLRKTFDSGTMSYMLALVRHHKCNCCDCMVLIFIFYKAMFLGKKKKKLKHIVMAFIHV